MASVDRPATHEGVARKTFTPLKATFRIGSVHGRLSYAHDEKAFHKSEVPFKAMDAKRHIRMLKRGNRLGLRQSTWNNSTYTEERLCVRNQNQLSAHGKFSALQCCLRLRISVTDLYKKL